ncbi:MAG: hypothetical protein KDE31_18045, partial [Caldilineaceae bacterium]|nr:hypothetical protein [Caldilineaceae bacterium]
CHGPSEKDQAGNLPVTNAPQALLTLLQAWKSQQNGQPTATPTPVSTPVVTLTPVTTPGATPTPGFNQRLFLPVTKR